MLFQKLEQKGDVKGVKDVNQSYQHPSFRCSPSLGCMVTYERLFSFLVWTIDVFCLQQRPGLLCTWAGCARMFVAAVAVGSVAAVVSAQNMPGLVAPH